MVKLIEIEGKAEVTRGLRRGGNGELLIKGYGIQLGMMKRLQRWMDSGDSCTQV